MERLDRLRFYRHAVAGKTNLLGQNIDWQPPKAWSRGRDEVSTKGQREFQGSHACMCVCVSKLRTGHLKRLSLTTCKLYSKSELTKKYLEFFFQIKGDTREMKGKSDQHVILDWILGQTKKKKKNKTGGITGEI